MRRLIRFVSIVLIVLAGTGCSVLRGPDAGPEPKVRTGVARPASDVAYLLVYFEYVHKLPAADLAKEYDAVRLLSANSHADIMRVRYAMLLSVPGTPFNDDTRAVEMLEPLLKNAEGSLHTLAYLLSAQIQEQRRGQGLQQKLEALKALEKNLIERDPGALKRR
jgi:hypothetical protein